MMNRMASRRKFLQIGMAALALPMSVRASLLSSSHKKAADTHLYKVVFDERFPSGRTFARAAERRGWDVHAIRGDVTDLWFRDLDKQWKKNPVAIAGFTAYAALFCLERLSWDYGMRVVYRGDHRLESNGCVEHRFAASERGLREVFRIGEGRESWPDRVAEIVARSREASDSTRLHVSQATVTTAALRNAGDPELLVSWVIATNRSARNFHAPTLTRSARCDFHLG
jgi:hypothetical protein